MKLSNLLIGETKGRVHKHQNDKFFSFPIFLFSKGEQERQDKKTRRQTREGVEDV